MDWMNQWFTSTKPSMIMVPLMGCLHSPRYNLYNVYLAIIYIYTHTSNMTCIELVVMILFLDHVC
jgi:hypothetical protein